MVISVIPGSGDGRKQKLPDPATGEDSEGGVKSSRSNDYTPRWYDFKQRTQIERVSILPPEEDQKERKFQLLLSFGSSQDLSSQQRRTENARGIELEVEEKDLQPLARLVGRKIIVHYLLWSGDVVESGLREKNQKLLEEIDHLRKRLRQVQSQLQFTVESQIRDSR